MHKVSVQQGTYAASVMQYTHTHTHTHAHRVLLTTYVRVCINYMKIEISKIQSLFILRFVCIVCFSFEMYVSDLSSGCIQYIVEQYVTVRAKTSLVHTSDFAWLMTCKIFLEYYTRLKLSAMIK